MSNDEVVPEFDDQPCEGLTFTLSRVGDIDRCLLISLEGRLDSLNAHCFRAKIARAIDRGFLRLVLDLREVAFFKDDGIGTIVRFTKVVRPEGGDFVLIAVPARILGEWQLLGFSQFFNIRDTLDEAIAFLRGERLAFPRVFRCPVCSHKVRAPKPGRFRCRECQTIIVVDPTGRATLG